MDITSVLFGVPIRKRTVKNSPVEIKFENLNSKDKKYTCITDFNGIDEYFKDFWSRSDKVVAFDIECSPKFWYRNENYVALDPHKSEITGISFSHTPNTGIYIPLRHIGGGNVENIDSEDVVGVMKLLYNMIFINDEILKVAHNISYEAMYFYKHGLIIKGNLFDTICASQLSLNKTGTFRNLKESGLKTLTKEIFDVEQISFEEATGGLHYDELDPKDEATIEYACSDSDYTLQLYYYFKDYFEREIPKHYYICKEIESPVAVYCGMMKYNGVAVDKELMTEKQEEAEKHLVEIKSKIDAFAGRDLDIGANASTNAFKDFLYKELELPVLKTTAKFKEAADDEAFIRLKEYCQTRRPEVADFISLIQDFRKWSKIKSTYIDGFLKTINTETNRIHANVFPLGTDTGRFAYRNPNLQTNPRKDNDPIGVRNFFRAKDGYVLLDFDFSQIELRVGAYFCRDKKMLNTYREDGDIHAITTSIIYGLPYEEAVDKNIKDYKERRTIAKGCNFGIFFGLFPKGLQRTLKFKAGIEKTEAQCERIINNIKAGYPGLVKWQTQTKSRARINKYSETALGRRRILKGINSGDWGTKSYWERCALNTPIQGTAADILKLAMVRIMDSLADRDFIKPLLQIHDELLFEVREDKVDVAIDLIRTSMEVNPFSEFDVPIKAEGEIGYRFGELKEIEVLKDTTD
jgi:DNA polymerase-1